MKTNKRIVVLIFTLVAACVFLACAPASAEPYSASVVPVLTVTGDVENEIALQDFGEYTTTKIEYNDETLPSIQLLSVLQDAVPSGSEITLVLASPDGVMAEIPLSEIDENCVLLLTSDNGWTFHSEKHPRQSGIKQMDQIVVCAQNPASTQKCFRMIYSKEYLTRTYGQLFMGDATVFSVLEGNAQMNGNTTNAYTRRELIPLSTYTEELGAPVQDTALAYFGDGSQQPIGLDGYLEWRGTSADYIGADKKYRLPDIIGVWLDAPALSVTDIASFALDKAEDGNVLVIELDGVGYYNILELQPDFIGSKDMSAMRTVMPSISNVSLAAIVTGELPNVNGVTERRLRDLNVDDMFVAASKRGLDCAVIEGSTALVTMSLEQTLNPDINQDGDTDNEVLAAALDKLSEGYQFIYVHFHGYDDIAHTYGPSSEEASQKLDVLDGYVETLCDHFTGTVIITADHGQHTTNDTEKPGNHGEFLPIDLTVPFIIFEVTQ